MDDKTGNEAHTNGAGQSVNVVISEGSVRWLIVALLVILAMLFWTNRVSTSAELKSNQAVKTAEDAATELRMAQFWMHSAKLQCETKGVPMPALPANF